MPLPPELANLTLQDLDGTNPPPDPDVSFSDYGNALQTGSGQFGSAVNRGAEFLSNKVDASSFEDFFSENARRLEYWSNKQRGDYSPAAKAALATEFATTDPQNAAWAVWENGFSPIGLRMTESAPNMAATIGPLGMAARAGMSAVGLAGLEALLSGGISGSYVAGDIAKEVESLSTEQLKLLGGYDDYKAAGYSDADVRSVLKEHLQTGPVTGAAAAVGASGAIAGPLLGPLFRGAGKNSGVLARSTRAAAIEAPQEAFEETSENAATNIAVGDPALQGGLEAALSGAFVGGPTAAVVVGATGGKTRKQRQLEEGYKEVYKTGAPEQVELYRVGLTMGMGKDAAAEFMAEMEAEADKELAEEKARAGVTPEVDEALKAREPKQEPTNRPEFNPDSSIDGALAQAAATEDALYNIEGAAKDIDAGTISVADKGTVGPNQPVVEPTFTGTGLEHFDQALSASLDDAALDATKGKPLTTNKGRKSTRKERHPKARADALAGIFDDINESLATLKRDGYNTEPLEKVIRAFAKNRKGTLPSESIKAQFKHRSGGRFYISPYLPFKGKVSKLGGDKAIDQVLQDLQTARDEMEAAGTQEVFTEQAPTPEPRKSIKAQLDAVQDGRKRAVLVTPGTRIKKSDIPKGYTRSRPLPNGKGTLIYKKSDAKALKEARAWAKDEAANTEFASNILNYGVGSKPNTNTVTTARDKSGTVIQDVVGEGGPVQTAAEEVAGPDGTVETRPAEEATAEREQEVQREEQAPKKKSNKKTHAKEVTTKQSGSRTETPSTSKPAENIKEVLNRIINDKGRGNKYKKWLAKLILRNVNDEVGLATSEAVAKGDEAAVLAESLRRVVDDMVESNGSKRQQESLKELEKLRVLANSELSLSDFIVRGMLDEKFQNTLRAIKMPNERTMWTRFVKLVKDLLNVKDSDTAMGEFLHQFGQLVDAKTLGAVSKRIYHGSTESIGKFRATDLGVHFGTKEQANARNSDYLHDTISDSLTSVVRLSEPEGGAWHNPVAVAKMFEAEGIAVPHTLQKRINKFAKDAPALPPDQMGTEQRNLITRLRGELYKLGYDTVIYTNNHEATSVDQGGNVTGQADSYIFLNPELIKDHNVIKQTVDKKSSSKPAEKQPPKKGAAKKTSEGRGSLDAKTAAENLWKLASDGVVVNVANIRKNTGVNDAGITPERIRELLNTAIEEVRTGDKKSDDLPKHEQEAVKSIRAFVKKAVKAGSLKKQVEYMDKITRPPELKNKSGKGLTGITGKIAKLRLVTEDAGKIADAIASEVDNGGNELRELIHEAIQDPDAEVGLIQHLESLNADPAVVRELVESVQAGRLTSTGGTDVSFDRTEVVNNVVEEADGLSTDGVNALIDGLLGLSQTDRTPALSQLTKALRAQYGVSEPTANNLSRVINELGGVDGVIREESAYETGYIDGSAATQEDFAEQQSGGLYEFDSVPDEFLSIGRNNPEAAAILQKRARAGAVLNTLAAASNNNPTPITLVLDIVSSYLHTNDPMLQLFKRINKLGYGSSSLRSANIEGDASGKILGFKGPTGMEYEIVLDSDLTTEKAARHLLESIHTLAHEVTHMATMVAIDSNPNVKAHLRFLMNAVASGTNRQWYGLTDEYEFIAEAFSNGEFQKELNSIRSPMEAGKSIWQSFLDAIAKVLGLGTVNKNSVLEEVVSLSNIIFKDKKTADHLARRNIDKLLNENGVTLNDNTHPADKKLIRELYNRGDEFTAGAGEVLIGALGNDGKQKYDDTINTMKGAGSAVRRFMMGNMMLDDIETTYTKLFDGLMDNVDRLIMGDSYVDNENPIHVLIRGLQNRQASAKKFEAAANDLLERVKRIEEGDYKAPGLNEAKRRQAVQDMYDVAHDATMQQIHPDEEWDSKHNKKFYEAKKRGKNQAEIAHGEIRKRYKKLPREVQKLYEEMRDFYTTTQAVGRGKLRTNLIRRFNIDTYENLQLAATIMDDLTEQEINDLDLSGYSRADAADIRYALRSINNQSLPNGPYFPLLRYGNYIAEVSREREYEFQLSKYKNKTARKKAMEGMRDRLRAEDPSSRVKFVDVPGTDTKKLLHTEYQFVSDESKAGIERQRAKLTADGYTVGTARLKGETDFNDLSAASKLMAIAERKLKGDEDDKSAARTALREALVTFMPEYSMKKRLMERKYVAGASHDMGRALANYTKSAAWSLANLDYINDITEASHSMNRSHITAGRSNKYTDTQLEDMRHVAEELKRRVNNNNEPGKITEWSSKLGFFNYLFSISYSVVNSTQPALVTVPYLSGMYGIRKATAALTDAYGMIGGQIIKEAVSRGFGLASFTSTGVDANLMVTEVRQAIQRKQKDAGVDKMLKTLQDEDIIGATFALEITEMAKGRGRTGKVGRLFQKVMDMGRTMPHIVEIMNRTTTAVATYKLAKAAGKTDNEATEAARLAVRKTQFDYSELNRPYNFVRNDLLRAMTMFKIHPLGIYGLLIGNVKTLLNSGNKAEARAAGKTLAMLLATHGTLAGAAGSILLEPVKIAMGMLGLLFDDDDEMKKWLSQPDVAMRQLLYEATGSAAASEAITFGAPRLIGVDMHTRVGLQSLMFMGSNEGDTQFERGLNTVTDSLAGPILGMEGGFTRMAAAIANGQGWAKASEYAMPKGIRDLQRARRYNQVGMTDFNGNLIQDSEKFTAIDLAVRAIGFSPSIEAETQFGRGYIQRRKGRLRRKASGLTNRWKAGTPQERQQLWLGDIKEFNDSLSPEERRVFRITRGSLHKGLASRRRRERETEKGAHFTRKERALRKDLDFINLR